MGVADFRTTLAHLLRVCWAAAAGQLHLASVGVEDIQDDRSTLSSALLHSPPTSPLLSVMEEGQREGQLRAGLCVRQVDGAVSSKVCVCACSRATRVCVCALIYMYVCVCA